MYKILLIFSFFFLGQSNPEKRYLIVAGDISCKACVIELHTYLSKKTKKENLSIGLRDKGQLILNESALNYYQREIPSAQFQFLTTRPYFIGKEKYPYLLIITGKDTLKLPYDSLFVGEELNTKQLN